MTDKELEKLFKEKLGNQPHDYNPANWERMADALDAAKNEPLDNLFKEKLAVKSYPYNPKNWEKMAAILDGGAASRGGAFYWRAAAAILLFAMLAGGALLFDNSDKNALQDENRVVDFEENSPAVLEDENYDDGNSLDENGGTKNEANAGSSEIPNENIANQETSGGDDLNASQNPDFSSENNADKNAGGEDSDGKTVAENVGSDFSKDENNDGNQGGDAENSDANAITANPADGNASNENSRKPIFSSDDYETGNPNAISFYANQDALILDRKNIAKNAFLLDTENAPFSLMPLSRENEKFDPKSLPKFYKRHNLFAEGGAVLRGSYTSNSVGIGWQAGLGYQYRISDRWAANVGLRYSVHNEVGIRQKSDSIFFNFGQERIETERESHRLDYLEVPLEINFLATPKHQFSLGGYFAQLISVDQEIVRRRYALKQGVQTTHDEATGYNPDFARYDWGLTAGYRFHISPQFSAGISVQQGLVDITKVETVSNELKKHHRNLSTRISLRYLLF